MEEAVELVDRHGNTVGSALRSAVHGNPAMTHRVVHVLVFNHEGDLLLQKRSIGKDVAPGKWDTSVGGHVSPGEDLMAAVLRETREELGIEPENILFLYSYIHSNPYETEFVCTHSCKHIGPFSFNREEIDEVRFWSMEEIEKNLGAGKLSDNFEHEIARYHAFTGKKKITLPVHPD